MVTGPSGWNRIANGGRRGGRRISHSRRERQQRKLGELFTRPTKPGAITSRAAPAAKKGKSGNTTRDMCFRFVTHLILRRLHITRAPLARTGVVGQAYRCVH
ncbi:hypothetical protein EVAR_33321_1 [Eumeta japonica]|uniref:Uncharacterized protein n=1 Tax=Eumeta variegata TaxID=151549 RepID=A0A4C1WHT0_EUMVA|nr:hypothetical protein EVAR_33321_1 [Eumeta japonica]